MHGDISRRTFSERHGYRAVVLQQGRVVLDADFNEQGDLTAHHDEARTLDIVGRVGGALPTDPDDPGPFAIRAADGSAPAGVPWSDLVVTPGRYYVDGVLAESFSPVKGAGWPLTAQPYVRTIPGAAVDGLGEPPSDVDRCALYLEVSDHGVTADEQPLLRESALGGPDTSLRRQTAWQVRWAALAAGVCSDLDASWLARTPRRMIVGLAAAPPDADPCSITASGGYQRLENQLYRVQIHEGSHAEAGPTYLWSRENGSVVATPIDLGASTVSGAARIAIDREGRDAELDFGVGDLIEVTSTDHQLQRVPGYLARIVGRTGLDLDVTWLGSELADLAALGFAPLVRRWEGGPTKLPITSTLLEDGITVRFPNGGDARTGDHWLVPARAVRLAYGLSETRGTVEWPPPGAVGDAVPPMGPTTHIAPLGIVTRSGVGNAATWSLEHDCRRLFPPLTGLTTLDLVGGDGQEALPGAWLDEPVRVVVRNGSTPVAGARVRFVASDAGVLSPDASTSPWAMLEVVTGANGVAATYWALDPLGPVTQVLSVQRLTDKGEDVDVEVRATARVSVAREVAFVDEECGVFVDVETVDDALRGLARRVSLRLHGGDGQTLPVGREVLPYPIRIIADSACGPAARVSVRARTTENSWVQVAWTGEEAPATLTDPRTELDVETDLDGAALFWWQPGPGRTDTLELRLADDDPRASIVVTAHRERTSAIHPGAHITGVLFADGREFPHWEEISADDLREGVMIEFDEEFDPELSGHPGLRIELDLPWPEVPEQEWPPPIGTHAITLRGDAYFEGGMTLKWRAHDHVQEWMSAGGGLWRGADAKRVVTGRLVLDGWGFSSIHGHAVNTHTVMYRDDHHARHQLPSDDAIAGGTFIQWFWLTAGEGDRIPMPNMIGRSGTAAMAFMRDQGFTNFRVVPPPTLFNGTIVQQVPAAGTLVTLDTPITLTMASPQ